MPWNPLGTMCYCPGPAGGSLIPRAQRCSKLAGVITLLGAAHCAHAASLQNGGVATGRRTRSAGTPGRSDFAQPASPTAEKWETWLNCPLAEKCCGPARARAWNPAPQTPIPRSRPRHGGCAHRGSSRFTAHRPGPTTRQKPSPRCLIWSSTTGQQGSFSSWFPVGCCGATAGSLSFPGSGPRLEAKTKSWFDCLSALLSPGQCSPWPSITLARRKQNECTAQWLLHVATAWQQNESAQGVRAAILHCTRTRWGRHDDISRETCGSPGQDRQLARKQRDKQCGQHHGAAMRSWSSGARPRCPRCPAALAPQAAHQHRPSLAQRLLQINGLVWRCARDAAWQINLLGRRMQIFPLMCHIEAHTS